MNKNSTSRDSRTDWERINTMQDEDIDFSDSPEVTEEQMAKAVFRVGGNPVPQDPIGVKLLLDAEIVAYFKALAGEEGYNARINEALKASIQNQDLETLLRRIIREELQAVH